MRKRLRVDDVITRKTAFFVLWGLVISKRILYLDMNEDAHEVAGGLFAP